MFIIINHIQKKHSTCTTSCVYVLIGKSGYIPLLPGQEKSRSHRPAFWSTYTVLIHKFHEYSFCCRFASFNFVLHRRRPSSTLPHSHIAPHHPSHAHPPGLGPPPSLPGAPQMGNSTPGGGAGGGPPPPPPPGGPFMRPMGNGGGVGPPGLPPILPPLPPIDSKVRSVVDRDRPGVENGIFIPF